MVQKAHLSRALTNSVKIGIWNFHLDASWPSILSSSLPASHQFRANNASGNQARGRGYKKTAPLSSLHIPARSHQALSSTRVSSFILLLLRFVHRMSIALTISRMLQRLRMHNIEVCHTSTSASSFASQQLPLARYPPVTELIIPFLPAGIRPSIALV